MEGWVSVEGGVLRNPFTIETRRFRRPRAQWPLARGCDRGGPAHRECVTMSLRTWTIAMALAGAVGLVSFGCDFVFSYKSITAPVGTWGEVGIRVYKTHANCTLPSPYAYDIATAGVQILEETPWREVQPNVIEKWVILSLAEVGDGFLKISKTCTKEGYEEGILPIRVTAPTSDGAWFRAWS